MAPRLSQTKHPGDLIAGVADGFKRNPVSAAQSRQKSTKDRGRDGWKEQKPPAIESAAVGRRCARLLGVALYYSARSKGIINVSTIFSMTSRALASRLKFWRWVLPLSAVSFSAVICTESSIHTHGMEYRYPSQSPFRNPFRPTSGYQTPPNPTSPSAVLPVLPASPARMASSHENPVLTHLDCILAS